MAQTALQELLAAKVYKVYPEPTELTEQMVHL
jgi:hypothetical protein